MSSWVVMEAWCTKKNENSYNAGGATQSCGVDSCSSDVVATGGGVSRAEKTRVEKGSNLIASNALYSSTHLLPILLPKASHACFIYTPPYPTT